MSKQNAVIIDQRKIQKRGGKAAKYPVSYLITQLLYSVNAKKVLDLTYGEGRFYAYSKPPYLHGIDVKKLRWIVKPDFFEQKSLFCVHELPKRYDLIVIDPPFSQRKYRNRDHYTAKNPNTKAMINHACKIAKLNNIPYVLVHNKELYIPDRFEINACIDFIYACRYLANKDFKNTTKFYILKNPDRESVIK